ncbi:MAG: hypothetical protein IJ730_04905 [Alphaproteobacteria bacterium]|nr:hypothetical protein [Alphaproteobacteria bacterium]
MNKNILLILALLLISIYDFAQASERLIQKMSDPWHKSDETETVADRIQNVMAYRDFAAKQSDDATTHPKLNLVMPAPNGSNDALRKLVRYRKQLWKDAADLFQESLSYYEAEDFKNADEYLAYGLLSGEMAIQRALVYYCETELNSQEAHEDSSKMILNEILDAISDTPGSPAEYPAIRERLGSIKVVPAGRY